MINSPNPLPSFAIFDAITGVSQKVRKLHDYLQAKNKCDSIVFYDTITVKGIPEVSINPISNYCDSAQINPQLQINSCLSDTISYAWQFAGASPASSNLLNPGTITYNNTGTYTAEITITSECGVDSENLSFNINPSPIININPIDSICEGDNFQLNPIVNSGSTPYTYSWIPNTNISNTSVINPTVSPSNSTTYTLNVTDNNNFWVSN